MKEMIHLSFTKVTCALALVLSAGAAPSAFAGSTTLSFNGITSGYPLTTQFQSEGVTASGATIYSTAITNWTNPYGNNVAAAPTGLMTFTFNSSVTGNINSVSTYLSGNAGVGLYAYDASGTLLAQSVLSAAASSQAISVTSSTPIASVAIHDNGTTFAIDNLTFATQPACEEIADQLYSAVQALPASDFVDSCEVTNQRNLILKEVGNFESLSTTTTATQKQLLKALSILNSQISYSIKKGTDKTNLQKLIQQLVSLTNAGSC